MKEFLTKLESLDLVELLITLEQAGLSESQVGRLAPFLVAPMHVKSIRGSYEVNATAIARSQSAVIFLEDGWAGIGMGELDLDNTIWKSERFRNAEMAIRAFEREVGAQRGV